ncbi:MAG: translation initiation factor Sui1 [Burkholderiales bacterium]|nr:translation initiation factor Sui1 [Burkholderiales bacterium]
MKTNKGAGQGGLVYSTEHGKMCSVCAKPLTACVCRQAKAVVGEGAIRVRLETKGRKGKGVTLITGLPLELAELTQLSKQLKQKCGSGGTVKAGVIEVQGDHCESLAEALNKLGWNVKK